MMIKDICMVGVLFFWTMMHGAQRGTWCAQPGVLEEGALSLVDELTPLIEACMPIVYLERKETAYPMPVEEYFLNGGTRLLERGTNKVIIPAGQMSFARLDAITRSFWKNKQHLDDLPYYVDVPHCVLAGADPLRWTDATGSLTVPAYVLVIPADQPDTLYLQCIFFYGYNAPYEISVAGITLFSGDKHDFQNAHEADVEHITIEVDTKKSAIRRIFYGAHGSREGMWVDAHDIEMEQGHPIVYAARGSHGNYPRVGTWVRILGFANDITGKDIRWAPQWRRIFMPYNKAITDRIAGLEAADTGYKPEQMGWILAPAQYGRRGVSALWSQWWLGNPKENTRTLADGLKLFCPTGNSSCIRKKSPDAQIPGGNPKELELIVAVWKAANSAEQFTKDAVRETKQALTEATHRADQEIKRIADDTQKAFKKAANTVDKAIKSAANDVKKTAQSTFKKAKRFFRL